MFVPALIVCIVSCAAVDTILTRFALPHRMEDGGLALQALVAWVVWGFIVAWPVSVTTRRTGKAFASALGWTVLPVALNAVFRNPLRIPGGLSHLEPWIAFSAVLGGLTILTLASDYLDKAARHRFGQGLIALALLALLTPVGRTGSSPSPTGNRGGEGPNLLLLVWDTTRAENLGPYGYNRATTPHLSALAKQGTLFENAFSASVFTLSSHVSILTGLPPSLHGTTKTRRSIKVPLVAEILQDAGWRTGAFVATSVLSAGSGLENGFEIYDDRVDPPLCDTHLWRLVHDIQSIFALIHPVFAGNGLPHWWQNYMRPAEDTLSAAQRFIEEEDDRPWFVFVNLFDVHWPYVPSDASRHQWVRDYDGPMDGYLFRSGSYPANHQPTDQDRAHLVDLYDAEMWSLDQAVDRFLQTIDLELGDTAVIVTADHGEAFGEQGHWSHEALHGPQTRIPLVVVGLPGQSSLPQHVSTPVGGTDIAPTLLDLAGLSLSAYRKNMSGESLLGKTTPDRIIPIQDLDNHRPESNSQAVIRGSFKLLEQGGVRTLHDYAKDPFDTTDLSDRYPETAVALGEALDSLNPDSFDDENDSVDLDALRALGYLGGGDSPPEPDPDQ